LPANLVARRICGGLANGGKEPKLSVSIGVAVYPKDGEKVDFLLGAADATLYAMKAKAHGPEASTQRKRAEGSAVKRRDGNKTSSVNG